VKKTYLNLDTTALQIVPELLVHPSDAKNEAKNDAKTAPPYALARFPAGSEAILPRFTRQSWYATSIGAATAIDEYVPIRIPTTRANENPCNTSPPNRYSDITVRNVRPDEITVRLSV
jgi:hypothetical protein